MTTARHPDQRAVSPGALYESFDVIPMALRAIPDCTPHTERVFATLWRLSDRLTRRVDGHPLIDIATEAGVAKGTVVKSLDRLVEWGFVAVEGGGRGRGNVASYILLERRTGTTLRTTPRKGHVDRTPDREKVTDTAPHDPKRSRGDLHPSEKGSPDDPHPRTDPYIENQRVITEQARRTRMLACPRCAEAHRRLYPNINFDQHRKRWGRATAAVVYVQVVYLAAHSPGGVTNPSGLMRAIGRCYRNEDRPCSRAFCNHGPEAVAFDLETRHRHHTEHHPIRETTNRWFDGGHSPTMLAQVVELTAAITMPEPPVSDLDARRRQLSQQLHALHTQETTA